jgi:predicted RNA binding protein YcfA (HicA-like mRNA interferase family)
VTQRLPSLTPEEMVRALQRAGLYVVRETGKHIIMHKQGLRRPVPIPRHVRDLKRGLQAKIIKEAGLTSEEFSQLLRG